ncbi:PLP-dependent aminotransferase family protein [Rhodoferax sp. PAMC 29310]|uniref:MocR-like pyridoxine biosynthesis transcription factor PdxR n=1 Tax=Rhodoferax sp. PAMC 29310 TaxID=2822760 RepID=UPI001B3219A7|nr:PLP-dependent aminotransferase family protein [Rhodoferax sp. PAMC 29310]
MPAQLATSQPSQPSQPSQAAAFPDFVLRQFVRQSGERDHRQLYRIIQTGIRDGVLPAGLKLAPTRGLAQSLGIARNTVVHVYEQLGFEGYVEAGVGRGTYVSSVGGRLADHAAYQGPPMAHGGAPTLSRRGSELVDGAGAGRRQWGAFTPGVPEVRLFPARIWSRLQSRLWRNITPQHLCYSTGAGDADLRRAVAEYLQGARGVVCTPEQVIITSGTQQSLHLIGQLLADPGDAIWLEDPGYWGARSVFHALGLKLVPVDVDGEGLAPSEAQLREPPRAMFVTPSHQYPVGTLMSQGRRQQLLDYAAAHSIWLIEDDYDSEFRYGAWPAPALQGLDQHGRVLYLGTFSKTLFPAIRLAYLVVPPDLAGTFERGLNELYREGQLQQQAVLARFLSEGHYASHVRKMRGVYGARHDALIAAITRSFGSLLPVIGGDAGLHLVLGLPKRVDDVVASRKIMRAGVSTRPLSEYSIRPTSAANGLLLGYAAVPEDEIRSNFSMLASVVQSLL